MYWYRYCTGTGIVLVQVFLVVLCSGLVCLYNSVGYFLFLFFLKMEEEEKKTKPAKLKWMFEKKHRWESKGNM